MITHNPFFIFDLDGTLANIGHRVHFLKSTPKRWPEFFAACVDDEPNWPVFLALGAHIAAGHKVEIWSARNDSVRPQTEAWLSTHNIRPSRLTRMRADGDRTLDTELKMRWLAELRESGIEPTAVYDDRTRVVEAWRAAGVHCFQVNAAKWDSE